MKLTLTREYYSECYDQIRKYGAKSLLFERVSAVVLIIFGIGLYIYLNVEPDLSVILICLGVFELFSNSIKKQFWLRRQTKGKLMNAEIELLVSESGIDSTGPFSNGHFDWIGIEKIVRTPKGILVWPQKGTFWYVPESVAGTETIEFIQSKAS